MKNRNFILRFLFIFTVCQSAPAEMLNKKYPYGLLTPDYGILNENDLLINTWRGNPKPFQPNDKLNGFNYWQCFPTNSIKPIVRSWKEPDIMNLSRPPEALCELTIQVSKSDADELYAGRRAMQNEFCSQFLKDWKRLTFNEPYVCLNGEYADMETIETVTEKRNVHNWIYDKIKTRKGCWSYFEGYCDIKRWQKLGYPKPSPSKSHTK